MNFWTFMVVLVVAGGILWAGLYQRACMERCAAGRTIADCKAVCE